MALAARYLRNRRERQAAKYDEVGDQIEDGSLTIRGVEPDQVVDRMRDKAAKVRAGESVHRRRRIPGNGLKSWSWDEIDSDESI